MAAPSGTVWGDYITGSGNPTGRRGKIGLYVTYKDSSTSTSQTRTYTVQVWFWTIYSCSDGSNSIYYNAGTNVSSATTKVGSKSISHTVATGSGWSTSNQTLLYTATHSINRGTSAQTFKVYSKYSGIDMLDGTMSVSKSYTVPALSTYAITYNANGGSGAPTAQTKTHGTAITLSSTKPTRDGYTFKGWATSSTATTAKYQPGASYTGNAKLNLYAVWAINTYTIKYDANGGTGAPANQTKTHGKTLTLQTGVPKRADYDFLGWSTSKTATTATYQAGGSYTANSAATLYAVWQLAYVKPRVTNLAITRCNSEGGFVDDGEYALIHFDWECDKEISDIAVDWESANSGSGAHDITPTGTSGTVDEIVGGTLSSEANYSFTIIVSDTNGFTTIFGTLAGTAFVIDFLAGGLGAAFGKPAELKGVLDIAFQTRHLGGLLPIVLEPETDLNTILTPNTYVGANLTNYNYTCGGEALPLSSGTFTLEVVAMGEEGQLKQSLSYCHKTASRTWERIYHKTNDVMSWGGWVCVSDFDGQLLWEGGYYMSSGHTATLAENVSKQRSGIVLVFSEYYDSAISDTAFHARFIPKMLVSMHPGRGHCFQLSTSNLAYFSTKYLYIHDDKIVGHDNNVLELKTGSSGILYDNTRFVLRYVIGV